VGGVGLGGFVVSFLDYCVVVVVEVGIVELSRI